MKEVTTIGLDLAKHTFQVVGCDRHGHEVSRKVLRRGQVRAYFANLPAGVVGLEACASAHFWARELQALGHEVRMMPPQYVKAYVRGNKTDYHDARASAEAVRRPGMRVVAVKTPEQQDIQALPRLRAARVQERTALCNPGRGLLAAYGVVLAQGVGSLRRHLAVLVEEPPTGVSEFLRTLLRACAQQLRELDTHIDGYTRLLAAHASHQEAIQRLQTVPGVGPVVASVFHALVGTGQAVRRGREVSAARGLVPKQHSSGGKTVRLGSSKRGDRYGRSLLVHGARAVVRRAADRDDRRSRWVTRLQATRGTNKATVALANKLARIGWAVVRTETRYRAA